MDDFKEPVGYKKMGLTFTAEFFGGKLQLKFIYAKSFYDFFRIDWVLVDIIKNNPYAIVFNTGIWDYDNIARAHRGQDAAEYCENNETMAISNKRAAPFINESFWIDAALAKPRSVRLIYRNSHYNQRYGVHCADDKVEAMIEGSGWEIWDNRRISKEVWKEQNWDGFHFERIYTTTVQKHEWLVNSSTYYNFLQYKNYVWPSAGMLEIQFAQSLLQSLFHQCLMDKLGNGRNEPIVDSIASHP